MNIHRIHLRAFIFCTVLLSASLGRAADLQQGIFQYENRHYSDARKIFSEIEHEQGPCLDTDFYLGRLALWFDDLPEAIEQLERCARLAPQQARTQNALGDACGLAAQKTNIFAKLGWAKRCLAAYERAVELEPQNPAWRWSLIGYYTNAPCIAGGGMDKAYAQVARASAGRSCECSSR